MLHGSNMLMLWVIAVSARGGDIDLGCGWWFGYNQREALTSRRGDAFGRALVVERLVSAVSLGSKLVHCDYCVNGRWRMSCPRVRLSILPLVRLVRSHALDDLRLRLRICRSEATARDLGLTDRYWVKEIEEHRWTRQHKEHPSFSTERGWLHRRISHLPIESLKR